jgi:hypothetical protein
MPINAAQITKAGYTSIDFHARNNPIDQIAVDRPLIKKLMEGRKAFPGAKQYLTERARKSYDSNFQWFEGADQVTYNSKDTIRPVQFVWGEAHDGYVLTESELLQNGISVTDDRKAEPSESELVQLVNLLEENAEALDLGFKEKFDYELHLDGTQNAKSIPGLDNLISLNPTVGTVAGIDRSQTANIWWRNNFSTAIAAANLIDQMEKQWRACTRNGGSPDFILAGDDFMDVYRAQAGTATAAGGVQRTHETGGRKGIDLDGSVSGLFFKGVPIIWDPVFDDLDANLAPATPWSKRCYFINSRHLRLRPASGQDMVTRKPPRVYDRYAHYFAKTWRGAMTMTRANAHSVLAIS